MTDVKVKQRCIETVSGEGQYGGFHRYPCKRPATVTRDGKRYCTSHDPERVKARNKASWAKTQAKYEAKRLALAHAESIARAERAVVAAAEAFYEYANTRHAFDDAVRALHAARAKGVKS